MAFLMVLVIIARLIHPITSCICYHNSEVFSWDMQDRLFPAKNDPRVVVTDVATEQSHNIFCTGCYHLRTLVPAECPAQTALTCLLGRDDFSALRQKNMLVVLCSLRMKAHQWKVLQSRLALRTQGTIPDIPTEFLSISNIEDPCDCRLAPWFITHLSGEECISYSWHHRDQGPRWLTSWVEPWGL